MRALITSIIEALGVLTVAAGVLLLAGLAPMLLVLGVALIAAGVMNG